MAIQQFVDAPPLNAPVTKPTQVTTIPVPTKPVESPPAAVIPKTDVEAPKVSSSDILSRTTTTAKKIDAPPQETSYREDLEKITDPSVKAIAEKAIKDFESGYNKKFQSLADQRKELESMQQNISTWTPQRLQEELKNPAFVQAMQILKQQAPPPNFEGSTDEWSALSPQEKQRMQSMEQEQRSIQSQLQTIRQKEEDLDIKKSYPDYEPQVVDEAIEGLRSGQITASRADIWKVVNHDKNVEKGYQFGYEDGYKKALEKFNASSMTSSNGSVTGADEVPDDVRKGGFSSIAMWRLNRARNRANKQ